MVSNWGNLGKVNYDNPDVIPATCPGVAGSAPPRANGTEMRAAGVCPPYSSLSLLCFYKSKGKGEESTEGRDLIRRKTKG